MSKPLASPRLGLLGDSFIYASPTLRSEACRHSVTLACAIGPEPLDVRAEGQRWVGHLVAVRPFVHRWIDSGGWPVALIDLEPAHPRYNTFSRSDAAMAAVRVLDPRRFAGLMACARAFAARRLEGVQLRASVALQVVDVADSIAPHREVDGRVLRMMAALRMDPATALSPLAQQVGLSARRASQAFASSLGLTIRQYALAEKIRRAAMFFGSGRALTDIAQLCGFADSAHLAKVWLRCYGACPSLYFDQLRGAEGAVDQAWRQRVSLAPGDRPRFPGSLTG